MKKFLVTLLLLTTLSVLLGCGVTAESGASASSTLFIKLKVDDKEYSANSTVLIHLNFGHKYPEEFINEYILRHVMEVFSIPGNQSGDPGYIEDITPYYSITFEGDDIASEEYRDYSVDFYVDLSLFDLDSVVIVARISEVFLNTVSASGTGTEVIESTEVLTASLYLLKTDSIYQFSNTKFTSE